MLLYKDEVTILYAYQYTFSLTILKHLVAYRQDSNPRPSDRETTDNAWLNRIIFNRFMFVYTVILSIDVFKYCNAISKNCKDD